MPRLSNRKYQKLIFWIPRIIQMPFKMVTKVFVIVTIRYDMMWEFCCQQNRCKPGLHFWLCFQPNFTVVQSQPTGFTIATAFCLWGCLHLALTCVCDPITSWKLQVHQFTPCVKMLDTLTFMHLKWSGLGFPLFIFKKTPPASLC